MTNAQILSAVINKWGQPFIQYLANNYIGSSTAVQFIQNKAVSWGIASPKWSLLKDLSPFIEGATQGVAVPVLTSIFSKIDDSVIPHIAHNIVDTAIERGKLAFIEGKIEIEEEDLRELKRLLELNLPLEEMEVYEVITDDK